MIKIIKYILKQYLTNISNNTDSLKFTEYQSTNFFETIVKTVFFVCFFNLNNY